MRENGFKETEIGLIPEDWEVVGLGEVAEVKAGQSAPQGEKYFKNGKYPFIRVQHIDNNDYRIVSCDMITDEAVKDYRLKLFPKGTIIFPKSGAAVYLEKRAMLPFDAYIVSHLCALNSKSEKAIQKFLFYHLINKKLAEKKAEGYPTLNLSEVKEIKIPLPPLSEQQKIAKVLDKIQQAIELQDRIIELLKNLKKSLMQKLFTEGLYGEEQKETETEPITKSWKVIRFEDSILKKKIKVGKIKQQEYKEYGKYPVIDQSQNYIAGFSDNAEKVYRGPLPVIIFGDHTRIFKFVNFPFIIGADGVKIIIPNTSLFDPLFLYFTFLKLDIPSRGYNRHYQLLRDIKIPLPPLEEQKQIAHILSTVDKKIEVEQRRKEVLKDLFKTMLHKLMSGEIRLKEVEI